MSFYSLRLKNKKDVAYPQKDFLFIILYEVEGHQKSNLVPSK
jgi:hypothetical protein